MCASFSCRLHRTGLLAQRGMALVLVLWILTLLTIMAGSFTLSMRREAAVISSIKDAAEALAIAEAGIALAQDMLLNEGQRQPWKKDGTIYQLGFADAEVRLQLFNERGKVDINLADEEQLTTLLAHLGIEGQQQSALVDAILDWRDNNDLVRINGAESDQYEEQGLQYAPRNAAFKNIDEFQLVLGVDAALFRQIQPLITVHSKQKKIDKKNASAEILQAFFEDIEESTLPETEEQDEVEQQDLVNRGSGRLPIDEEPDLSNDFEDDSESLQAVYTIVAESRIKQGGKAMIKTIVKQAGAEGHGRAFEILEWKRMQTNDLSLFEDFVD